MCCLERACGVLGLAAVADVGRHAYWPTVVGAGAAIELVHGGVVARAAEVVVAGAAGDGVTTDAAGQGVVADAAGQGVIADTAVDRVVERGAGDGVVAAVAVDGFAGVGVGAVDRVVGGASGYGRVGLRHSGAYGAGGGGVGGGCNCRNDVHVRGQDGGPEQELGRAEVSHDDLSEQDRWSDSPA
jgi:hypothetical protein